MNLEEGQASNLRDWSAPSGPWLGVLYTGMVVRFVFFSRLVILLRWALCLHSGLPAPGRGHMCCVYCGRTHAHTRTFFPYLWGLSYRKVIYQFSFAHWPLSPHAWAQLPTSLDLIGGCWSSVLDVFCLLGDCHSLSLVVTHYYFRETV